MDKTKQASNPEGARPSQSQDLEKVIWGVITVMQRIMGRLCGQGERVEMRSPGRGCLRSELRAVMSNSWSCYGGKALVISVNKI